MEKTLIILKPDCVSRGLIGEIIRILERRGFNVVGLKMLQLTQDRASEFYAIHKGREFYNRLVKYMASGPIVAMVIEGKDTVVSVRELIGATDPRLAVAGTIRSEYAINELMNVIHASDSVEIANREISFFFKEDEIFHYQRQEDKLWR
jgi:nucleoside-diphosphate kinase